MAGEHGLPLGNVPGLAEVVFTLRKDPAIKQGEGC